MGMKNKIFINNTMSRKIIYVYRKNYSEEEGFLKIGEASIDIPGENLQDDSEYLHSIAEKRIRSYELSSPITILYTTLAVKKNWECFTDHDVHEVLKRNNFPKIKKGKSTEWFEISLETAKDAINAVKEGKYSIKSEMSSKENYVDKSAIVFRPEQEEAIKLTRKILSSRKDMLWNAKMRFGKTLTALELIKREGYTKTLILTHRPNVDIGWYDDFKKIFVEYPYSLYKYGSKQKGEKASILFSEKNNTPFVYFASMQDLRGSNIVNNSSNLNKNEEIFKVEWDLVIIDEAHEGTKTELAIAVVEELDKEKTKFLKLSGTPFNLLDEFDESQIFTWDYVMEQEAKKNWDTLHYGDNNPYNSLPEMQMFVYELSKILKSNSFIDIENNAFNFLEFFRVDESENFIYEKEIWSFLNLITRSDYFSSDVKTNMPFSTEEFRSELRHTLWTLPSRKSAVALEKLLKIHSVFQNYNIANLVDDDNDTSEDMKKINDAVTKDPDNAYSITLTVRKGTVGTTVGAWTGILVLNNTESASNYLQSIFRVQSPFSSKRGQKERAYVFDFAPDRTLKMVAEAAKLNVKGGTLNTLAQKEQMSNFLNFLPIIGIDGNRMTEYSVQSMLTQLKRSQAERAVRNGFDDTSIYSDELFRLTDGDLKDFDMLKTIIGKTKQSKNINKIDINNQGLTDEEWEKAEIGSKKNPKQRTEEEIDAINKRKALSEQRNAMISILRGISIRIPLMIYGMELNIDDDVTLESFTDKIDDISWKEFMPDGITKYEFKKFSKFYDSEIFIEAGRRIRLASFAADKLSFEDRIDKIASIFAGFKNPDKETVLTPWRVINMHLGETIGGYNFFDTGYPEKPNTNQNIRFINRGTITNNVFNKNSKVLEINSKTGLYPLYMAYNIYKIRWNEESINWDASEWISRDKALWKEVLENNIFVLNKTPMARTITYRTLYGYQESKEVSSNLIYVENLTAKLRSDVKKTVLEIKRNFGGSNMKFDIVVGNPPYQETVKAATNGNNANTVDVFQYFQESALLLGKANSLIYPAKELQRGKMNLMDERLISVRIYNGSNKSSEKTIPDEPSVFGDAVRRIPGDVGIFLWDTENTTKTIEYQNTIIKRTDKILPVRKEFINLSLRLIDNAGTFTISTIKKCCESNFVEKNPQHVLSIVKDRKEEVPKGYTKVLTNNKGGSGGKADWYYIKTDKLDFVQPELYKVVIGSAFPNEGFKNPNNIEILSKNEMFGRTKMSLYTSENIKDVENFKKFTLTFFAKVIVNMTPQKFFYYMPHFDDIKDSIDWTKSIDEIDKQLFEIYSINQEEMNHLKMKI